jgi:hypothetical protein
MTHTLWWLRCDTSILTFITHICLIPNRHLWKLSHNRLWWSVTSSTRNSRLHIIFLFSFWYKWGLSNWSWRFRPRFSHFLQCFPLSLNIWQQIGWIYRISMISNINNRPANIFAYFRGFCKASKCSLIFLQLKVAYNTVQIFQNVPSFF